MDPQPQKSIVNECAHNTEIDTELKYASIPPPKSQSQNKEPRVGPAGRPTGLPSSVPSRHSTRSPHTRRCGCKRMRRQHPHSGPKWASWWRPRRAGGTDTPASPPPLSLPRPRGKGTPGAVSSSRCGRQMGSEVESEGCLHDYDYTCTHIHIPVYICMGHN